MDQRPILDKNTTVTDFKAFYWLKEELVVFCRNEGLPKTGSKIEIAHRIEQYLKTGKKEHLKKVTPKKQRSKFDWNSTSLEPDTLITDNYKNTENVRLFFEKAIGKQFKFNVVFMNWMKANVGKTLSDAITAWHQIQQDRKTNKQPKEIAPQFEYNRYLRDFLADNPDKTRKDGIALWNIKKTIRGDNIYVKSDLDYLKK